jgi:hypothetical protein
MWVKLGHTSHAVEKIRCDTFKLKFFGQCVPFIAASGTRGKVEQALERLFACKNARCTAAVGAKYARFEKRLRGVRDVAAPGTRAAI